MENSKYIDHTNLKATATYDDILKLCNEANAHHFASVCVNPSNVSLAHKLLKDTDVLTCTVVGFPLGATPSDVKAYETTRAIQDGADEIDMVINIGWAKDQRWDDLLEEIKAVKAACGGRILKVIIETCLLTDEEKIKLCEIVSASGADYIKTSTGFAGGGATREDVALFARHAAPHVKIKAAGGISSLQDAEDFLDLGASRLGTSRIIKAVKGLEGSGY